MTTNKFNLVIAAALCVGLSANAFAGKTYKLKGEPAAGTRIVSTDAESALPFNKRYFELSDAERQTYRAQFNKIGANEIPPFPQNGLKDVYRPLIDANDRGFRGILQVDISVNEQGEVQDVKVINSPNRYLTASSIAALKKTKFTPGYCQGAPCAMTVPVKVNYQ